MDSHEEKELFRTDAEVERLVSMFEACTLPRQSWTHRAHLTVGLWYLVKHGEAVATELIRRGIQRYNQACGIETTATSGYHETITLFYARMIERFLSRTGKAASLAVLAEALFNSIGDKRLPLDYYSRERLMSREARTGWLEPDLKSLD
ncbi:MAG: hypothetical protein ICV60_04105 [Pyrinomonadaceae bacterium]|nr:hypothetical protein [Pyrinomonadaceae bacterium]